MSHQDKDETWEPVTGSTSASVDLVSIQARAALELFSARDRLRIVQAFQAAPSELQREMIQRALAAGETAERVFSFARAIRSLNDEQLFKSCVPLDRNDPELTLGERLRAMADPTIAFESRGSSLVSPDLLLTSAHQRERASRDLGVSEGMAPPKPQVEMGFAQDLMNQGVQALGLSYREEPVDRGGLTLSQALSRAAQALTDGLPVPVVLGPKIGRYTRYALLLQVQRVGTQRSYQLHDPTEFETVWVHEKDLLAGTELPLKTKTLRRITAMALPSRQRT